MVSALKFLAVLDDDFFKEKIYEKAEKLDGTAEIIWFRFKNYNNIQNKLVNIRKLVKKSILSLSSDYMLAEKYGFDGVHLNKNTIKDYNIIKSETNLITGYSSHSAAEIDNIKADYYTLSPIFHTPKNYEVKPLGIIDYDETKKVFALGGINLENLDKIKDSFYGFAGIRIINDIIKASF